MTMKHRGHGNRCIFAGAGKIVVLRLPGHMIAYVVFRFIKQVKNDAVCCSFLDLLCADYTYKKLKNAIKIGKQCVFDKTKMMIRSNCPENPTPKWRMFWKKPKGEDSMQKP